MAPDGGTYAGCCEMCNGEPDWALMRRGDAVVSWACHAHLSGALLRLQPPHDDPTEIVVTPSLERRIDMAITQILGASDG